MKAVVRARSLGGRKHEPSEPYECKDCLCLVCNFKGECHCPLKEPENTTPPVGCENYQRR